MATKVQRVQAWADALLNRTVTPTELTRLGEAIADAAGRLQEYQTGTNSDKATVVLQENRRWVIGHIKAREAAAAITSTTTSIHNSVDLDFAETGG